MVNGTVIIGPLTHVNSSTSKADSNLNFIPNYKRTRDHYFSLSVKDQNFFVNIAILFYNILYKNSDVSTFSNNSDSLHISHSDLKRRCIYFNAKDESIYHNLYIGGNYLVL